MRINQKLPPPRASRGEWNCDYLDRSGSGCFGSGGHALRDPAFDVTFESLATLRPTRRRKVHVTAMPRLGGIGIIAGVLLAGIPAFVTLAGMTAQHDGSIVKLHTALLFGALAVFVVGLLDDLFTVPSRFKLIALVAGSLCVCGAGGALTELRGSHLTIVEFHWVTSWLITIVWITGFAVAFNFFDGLNDLSSGLALLASLVLAAFLLQGGHPAAAIPAVVLAGSLVGFLYFNWHPARTFMGDGGSLMIGYLIGALTIMNNPSIGTIRSMFIPSLALSVALVDTALTLFRRRYQQRRSLFSAERGHIHHRLLDRGFSHLQAVKLIHGVSIAAVGIGLVSSSFDSWATLGGISLVVPLLWMFFHFAGSMHTGDMVTALRKKREIGRTSRRFRDSFETLQLEFDEGQLAGRPVIATNAGGAAEIVRDGGNGLLTTPGDATELVEAIDGLLKMPEEAAHLAQRGLVDARQRFGLDACVARVNELIAGVVSK